MELDDLDIKGTFSLEETLTEWESKTPKDLSNIHKDLIISTLRGLFYKADSKGSPEDIMEKMAYELGLANVKRSCAKGLPLLRTSNYTIQFNGSEFSLYSHAEKLMKSRCVLRNDGTYLDRLPEMMNLIEDPLTKNEYIQFGLKLKELWDESNG